MKKELEKLEKKAREIAMDLREIESASGIEHQARKLDALADDLASLQTEGGKVHGHGTGED